MNKLATDPAFPGHTLGQIATGNFDYDGDTAYRFFIVFCNRASFLDNLQSSYSV